MEKKKRHMHVLPNVITAFGLSCGLFVIFKMTMVEFGTVDYNTLLITAGILILATFADVLDGAVARAMNAQSYFGGIFDSLSDAITFGVCPAVVVIKSLSVTPRTELSFFVTTAAMLYVVCGVLRLARFNMLAKKAEENPELLKLHSSSFTGLPIPAAALAILSGNMLFYSEEFQYIFSISESTRTWLSVLMLVFIGYLMVSRIKFPSVKNLRFKVKSFRTILYSVIGTMIFFYGIISHFAVLSFICAWAYIFTTLALHVFGMIFGRQSTKDELDEEDLLALDDDENDHE